MVQVRGLIVWLLCCAVLCFVSQCSLILGREDVDVQVSSQLLLYIGSIRSALNQRYPSFCDVYTVQARVVQATMPHTTNRLIKSKKRIIFTSQSDAMTFGGSNMQNGFFCGMRTLRALL